MVSYALFNTIFQVVLSYLGVQVIIVAFALALLVFVFDVGIFMLLLFYGQDKGLRVPGTLTYWLKRWLTWSSELNFLLLSSVYWLSCLQWHFAFNTWCLSCKNWALTNKEPVTDWVFLALAFTLLELSVDRALALISLLFFVLQLRINKYCILLSQSSSWSIWQSTIQLCSGRINFAALRSTFQTSVIWIKRWSWVKIFEIQTKFVFRLTWNVLFCRLIFYQLEKI